MIDRLFSSKNLPTRLSDAIHIDPAHAYGAGGRLLWFHFL